MRDPIVDEIHRYREERSAKFKHDLSAMFKDLRRMEEESRAQGAKFVTLKRRRKCGLAREDVARVHRSEVPLEEPVGDPIIDEIRRARRENAARFGYNIDAIAEDARKRERKSGHRVILPPHRRGGTKRRAPKAIAAKA